VYKLAKSGLCNLDALYVLIWVHGNTIKIVDKSVHVYLS